jgi:hypothetical protein
MGTEKTARALAYLAESTTISFKAVQEDRTEEIESYDSSIEVENHQENSDGHYLREPVLPNKKAKIDHEQLKKNLKKASKDIIVGNTQTEYRR